MTLPKSLSTRPEIELLLCCARTQIDSAREARARELLHETLDWDELLRMSLRHGVMPLVYRHLSNSFADAVPAEHLQDFRQHFQQNAARNLYLTGELCRILKLFEEHGIEAIPYKGPALAVCAYGNVALRQFIDLDILVRARDVRQASALMAFDGYEPHFKLSEAEEKAFVRLSYVQLFTRDEGLRAVELHWGIAPRFFSFPLHIERLWENAETITLGGMNVRAPATEDLLLLLCAHGNKDIWERLEWVCSIAEIVSRRKEIDWQLLVGRARGAGGVRMLLLGLSLAHELIGAELPPEISRMIREDEKTGLLRAQVIESMFAADPSLPTVMSRASFHLATRERLRDRVRYCLLLALTTTPVDWALVRLPRSLSFVYYVLRPFRLMKKYALKPSRHADSDLAR